MNKRSAMAIAAGLVAALLTGALALSLGMTGAPPTAVASAQREPRVRTTHRTVTVHRQAKAAQPTTITIVPANSSASTAASFSEGEGDEGGYEHEGDEGSSGSEGSHGGEGGGSSGSYEDD